MRPVVSGWPSPTRDRPFVAANSAAAVLRRMPLAPGANAAGSAAVIGGWLGGSCSFDPRAFAAAPAATAATGEQYGAATDKPVLSLTTVLPVVLYWEEAQAALKSCNRRSRHADAERTKKRFRETPFGVTQNTFRPERLERKALRAKCLDGPYHPVQDARARYSSEVRSVTLQPASRSSVTSTCQGRQHTGQSSTYDCDSPPPSSMATSTGSPQ